MRRKRRGRFLLLLLGLAFTAVLVLARLRFYPLARDMAVMRVSNKTGNLINDAVDGQIKQDAVDYGSMVLLEKDKAGRVTALKTNIGEVNRLKTRILDTVNQDIEELDVEDLGIPLGNLILPALFSGQGPLLPVRILSVRNSDATFRNRFAQAGINQTLHQIIMDVTVQINIVTPAGVESVDVSSEVVVAETVIVGIVPDSYLAITKE